MFLLILLCFLVHLVPFSSEVTVESQVEAMLFGCDSASQSEDDLFRWSRNANWDLGVAWQLCLCWFAVELYIGRCFRLALH